MCSTITFVEQILGTLQRRLSLAGRMPRISPAFVMPFQTRTQQATMIMDGHGVDYQLTHWGANEMAAIL